RAYLCHRHLLFKGWLKQPNPSNQKRIMQIPHSKCRASGFVQSPVPPDLLQLPQTFPKSIISTIERT
ncbi:hypothetical protein, partial [Rhizobium ruizarguesonis]|uniref:hypothetical protein n=1 Tax=Rhizobium ruizarguesonis TaxID=2081791 RepID=UPI001A909816